MESPSKLFAAVLGLTAFAIALVSGLSTGANASETLQRGIFAMLICYGVGAVLGLIAGHAIHEFIDEYEAAHTPIDLDEVASLYDVSETAES